MAHLQSEQGRERLDRPREAEALLRASKLPGGMRISELAPNEARQLFLTDLIGSLAAASDEEGLQALAGIEGSLRSVDGRNLGWSGPKSSDLT